MNLDLKNKYMRMAINLAKKGINKTGLNPIVGAVLVKNKKVIGKGFHSNFGGDHAEIVAIKDAENKKHNIKNSILFVTLEPCCHTNKKTPPCVDTIIKKGIKEVYFLEYDINPKVNGKGIKKLHSNKVKVSHLKIKNSLQLINRGFEKINLQNRPFITLKICSSLDGRIYSLNSRSKNIGDKIQRTHSNKIRKNYDSILIGVNTIINDNPKLNFRGVSHKKVVQPTPIILDSNLRSPIESKIFQFKDYKPIIFCKSSVSKKKSLAFEAIGVKLVKLETIKPKIVIKKIMQLNFQRILIEGGSKVFSSFLKENLWDEMMIYYSKIFIGKESLGISDSINSGYELKNEKIDRIEKIGNSVLVKILQ